MPLKQKALAFWPNLNSNIPADWSRINAYNARFFQGDGSGFTTPSDTDQASHGHTVNEHDHDGNSHNHKFLSKSVVGASTTVTVGFSFSFSRVTHAHAFTLSSLETITYQTTASFATGVATAYPLSVKLIPMSPDDDLQDLPVDAVCFTALSAAPSGFAVTNGDPGTSDYGGLFVIGADPGGDAGGAIGSDDHDHTQSHGLVADDHGHSSVPAGLAAAARAGIVAIMTYPDRSHHTVRMRDTPSGAVSTDSGNVDVTSSSPAFIELLGIQNLGSPATPGGVIVGWRDSVASIPADFVLCDGTGGTPDCRDLQIRITTDSGTIGDTGGSNAHGHSRNHGHVHSAGHVHTAAVLDSGSVGSDFTPGGNVVLDNVPHLHTWTVNSTVPTIQNATLTTTDEDGRQDYRTLVWIQKVSVGGIAVLRRRRGRY